MLEMQLDAAKNRIKELEHQVAAGMCYLFYISVVHMDTEQNRRKVKERQNSEVHKIMMEAELLKRTRSQLEIRLQDQQKLIQVIHLLITYFCHSLTPF